MNNNLLTSNIEIKDKYDCIVIGAGPAGLASATTAKQKGAEDVLVIERDSRAGGILLQCIHTGFGLFEFNQELTGPEYAKRWLDEANKSGVSILTNAIVLSMYESAEEYDSSKRKYKEVTVSGLCTGVRTIKTKTVILSMGCRERTRGAISIPGTRPAGVLTAGCAQRLVNIDGYMPGRKVVILGSGDIGLIMARRMTIEGAHVVRVCEKMPFPGGLERNVQQCLRDFNIPLILSSTITWIHGEKRVEGVTITHFNEKGEAIEGSEEYIKCDTVMLSVGLIPENELSRDAGLVMDEDIGGPLLEANLHTSIEGVFACGNVYKVYDIVDNVSLDAKIIGKTVGAYLTGEKYKGSLRPEIEKEIPEIEDRSDPNVRILSCTICPGSCKIKSTKDEFGEWSFEGYSCKRGLNFAQSELIDPTRVLTSTVIMLINDSKRRMIPVRTSTPIPLRLMDKAIAEVKNFVLQKEIKAGDIIIENIADTKANLIATGI